jgi:nonsense-mediated mRNA decay protein 3
VCEPESKELLTMCIKRIKGLNKVRLVDANFVWTEPHSRRLKVKLTIQKEVFTSTILQQQFVIEYIVQTQMCDKCHRQEAKDTWTAIVQVRQKVSHKRTFFLLEQLILKYGAHTNCINVKERPDGLDFYYDHRSHALRFLDFLQAVTPIKFKQSERLVSQDLQSNKDAYKFSFSVEMVPVCRDDLVCVPFKLAAQLGATSPLLLCTKVSNLIYLIDPFTLSASEMQATTFFSNPFRALTSASDLISYTILDIQPLGPIRGKYVLADATVARTSDFGRNDTQFLTRTHLGHLLKPGDTALGYDVSTANFNDMDLEGLRGRQKVLPDLVLVRKAYPERRKSGKQRHWKLRQLDKEVDEDKRDHEIERENVDMERFMRDLEEDPELRSQINLYKDSDAMSRMARGDADMNDADEDDEEFPEVQLEELLDELTIQDQQDESDE